MARYTKARCRICRREGEKLFLLGRRCFSDKCGFIKRGFPPGIHGRTGRRRISPYGFQLREKQKLKLIYGLLEGQFRRFFGLAEKQGNPGENLIILLERRLDNIVYRLGLASSRPQARQLVRHNHFTVNGRKVNIPSYHVKVGDVVEVREKSHKIPFILEAMETVVRRETPQWLEVDGGNFRGIVKTFPTREELTMPINEQLIVELYSK